MKATKKISLIIIFCAFLTKNYAQIDTSFWFVAPDISQGLGDRPIMLYFNTYAQSATVKVRQPANGAFTPITKVIKEKPQIITKTVTKVIKEKPVLKTTLIANRSITQPT